MLPGWPHPAPGPLILRQARLRKPGEGLPCTFFPFFFFFFQKTDENELTIKKKVNTKTLKTVMIVDKQSWIEWVKGMRRGQGQGAVSLPLVHQCPTLPSKKGHPHRAQRPGQRGKAQEHVDWGHKHPTPKPGGQEKWGIIKAKKLQN